MVKDIDVAVIGAGPYGLSIAAHLAAKGLSMRVFGTPMHTWQTAMPKGMKLKSEGFASSLYDPAATYPIGTFCAERGIEYADIGIPTKVETFVAYGQAFQQRFVPNLEDDHVVNLTRAGKGFSLRLQSGATLTARSVVIAAGIKGFDYTPPELAALPPALVSHSSAYGDVSRYAGKRVTVIGAGASALDIAAALVRAKADVTLVARGSEIRFHSPPVLKRPLLERISSPWTGVGPGWKNVLCTRMPMLFHFMPEKFRLLVVRKHLQAAPGWFVRDEVEGNVDFLLQTRIAAAAADGDTVKLHLKNASGETRDLIADHVIAATGYQVDLNRIDYLASDLRTRIRLCGTAPALSRNFESSIPGLYFAGTVAANCFGPVLRFAYGARFCARRIAGHLPGRVRSLSRPAGTTILQPAPALEQVN